MPLPANMTEFSKTPFFTAHEFKDMGYHMVIWPVSSLRVANNDLPPLKWSSLKYDFRMEDRIDGKEKEYG
ncbi:MAG: Methylisocitrate lyase [Afipia sp.]|nr:MAG: Methylisocitrate lyase [Afipia sp.]